MDEPCPVCAAPTRRGAARCDQCLVAIDWTSPVPVPSFPFVQPGEPLYFSDLTRVPLPGRELLTDTLVDGTRHEVTPYGALATVMPGRALECAELRLRCRDACVRAAFTTIDEGVTIGCVGRLDTIGDAKLKYVLEIDPAKRTFCIDRGYSSLKVARFHPLVPWTPSALIGPTGHMNVVELRMQGPTLEARINDQHLTTIHDAVFGIGAGGIRISLRPEMKRPARATVHWFEMRGVVA